MARRDCNMFRDLYIAIVHNQDYNFSKSVFKISLNGINIGFPDKLFNWELNGKLMNNESSRIFQNQVYTYVLFQTFQNQLQKTWNRGRSPDKF